MTDATSQRVRQSRFELYRRAHEALSGGAAPAELEHIVAAANGCKRAIEAIELAEFHVRFRIPKRGLEHFVRQLTRCYDCARQTCVGEESP